jgi:hypothetical protein
VCSDDAYRQATLLDAGADHRLPKPCGQGRSNLCQDLQALGGTYIQ